MEIEYKIGDIVMRYVAERKVGNKRKLLPKFDGPFKIIDITDLSKNNTVKIVWYGPDNIDRNNGNYIRINISKLIKYNEYKDRLPNDTMNSMEIQTLNIMDYAADDIDIAEKIRSPPHLKITSPINNPSIIPKITKTINSLDPDYIIITTMDDWSPPPESPTPPPELGNNSNFGNTDIVFALEAEVTSTDTEKTVVPETPQLNTSTDPDGFRTKEQDAINPQHYTAKPADVIEANPIIEDKWIMEDKHRNTKRALNHSTRVSKPRTLTTFNTPSPLQTPMTPLQTPMTPDSESESESESKSDDEYPSTIILTLKESRLINDIPEPRPTIIGYGGMEIEILSDNDNEIKIDNDVEMEGEEEVYYTHQRMVFNCYVDIKQRNTMDYAQAIKDNIDDPSCQQEFLSRARRGNFSNPEVKSGFGKAEIAAFPLHIFLEVEYVIEEREHYPPFVRITRVIPTLHCRNLNNVSKANVAALRVFVEILNKVIFRDDATELMEIFEKATNQGCMQLIALYAYGLKFSDEGKRCVDQDIYQPTVVTFANIHCDISGRISPDNGPDPSNIWPLLTGKFDSIKNLYSISDVVKRIDYGPYYSGDPAMPYIVNNMDHRAYALGPRPPPFPFFYGELLYSYPIEDNQNIGYHYVDETDPSSWKLLQEDIVAEIRTIEGRMINMPALEAVDTDDEIMDDDSSDADI